MAEKKKIFVLDTNVLLHDYKSIYTFGNNDVVLPIIVLEELDKFKKGNDLINFQAREFVRELDKISGEELFSDGISLGNGLGKLFIETGKPFSAKLRASFKEDKADHKILAVADYYNEKNPNTDVILISKDINLRMKAKSLGITTTDYENDKVANIDELLYSGIKTIQGVENSLISKLYESHDGVSLDEFSFEVKPFANQYIILKSSTSSVLVHYNPFNNVLEKIDKQTIYNIDPRNAEQTFALDALMRPEIQLASITGKAGTGKTLLALAAALAQKKDFHQIFLARPIVPLSNRDLGFLPGNAKDKITPYMQPLFDNLNFIKRRFGSNKSEVTKIEEMLLSEKLLITPLAYIRGRSLSNIFFIIDEAQNLTPHEVKTIITRAGEGTKIIFTGDVQQIDSPYLDTKSNGLSYLTDKMKGQDIFTHVHLVKGERSYLADLASDIL